MSKGVDIIPASPWPVRVWVVVIEHLEADRLQEREATRALLRRAADEVGRRMLSKRRGVA